MQFASLTSEASTMILVGLYDVVYDFHQHLLRKLPQSYASTNQKNKAAAGYAGNAHPVQVLRRSSLLADYYLGINGIRYLQTTGEYPSVELRKRYRDVDRSAGFRIQCILLVEVCIELSAESSENVRYVVLTPTEYAHEDSEYHFLKDLEPSLCFTKHEGTTSTNYLLEVFDTTLPRYRVRKRLKDYLTFLTEGEWESERDAWTKTGASQAWRACKHRLTVG